MNILNKLLKEFSETCSSTKVWLMLGWMDIKQRYRGSFLGPFWITLSMFITIAALGLVYSRLFKQETSHFIPYLTIGMIIWSYFTSIIGESVDVFVSNKDFITNIRMPYFSYMARLVWRNILIFFHNLVVFVLVVLFFHLPLHLNLLFVIPGFIIATLCLFNVGLVLGILGARYRDVPPIVQAMITVIFFVTPILWQPQLLGENSLIIQLNPVNYLLEIIRQPLLGKTPHLFMVEISLLMVLLSGVFSCLIFMRYRRFIPFWL